MIYIYWFLIFLVALVIICVGFWCFAMIGSIVFGKVPFINSSDGDIDKIYDELKKENKDFINIADLGSGNGRVLISLKKRFPNSNCTGYEISYFAFFIAKIWARLQIVKINFLPKNFFETNLNKYDLVYCFLLTDLMLRLEKKLNDEHGVKKIVISRWFPFPGVKPYKIIKSSNKKHNIYFYRF